MFPPRTIARELEGEFTELVIQNFADRVLILVTQMGKVGTLLQVSLPVTVPLIPPSNAEVGQETNPPPPPAIQILPLFGSAQSEHLQNLYSLYAAQIATIFWLKTQMSLDTNRRSVIVGVALRKKTREDSMGVTESEKKTFEGIMKMLQEILHSPGTIEHQTR